ncbi:MAG: DUF664 domain-containing protein [Anaerolineae bacterium]|nr:DUF664 domain-containing protein [Anaerolineae bacterium]
MATAEQRSGRPRRYDLRPVAGCANQVVAYVAAMLDELRERLYDLITDLPQEGLDDVPQGASNSIAMLVTHMAWAEAGWVARITGCAIPDALAARLAPGGQDASGELPPSTASAGELIALCRDVRAQVTMPALAGIADVDVQVGGAQRPMTVRGVLMHLVWHWTYHSGQVGLLRRQWGATRYKWTFDRAIGAPRAE